MKLGMFTRNPAGVTWVKISQVLVAIGATERIITYEAPKVIKMDRIVDTTVVLREVTRPDGVNRCKVQTEKTKRLIVERPNRGGNDTLGDSMPSLESVPSLTEAPPL